jgi:hypothetical protein
MRVVLEPKLIPPPSMGLGGMYKVFEHVASRRAVAGWVNTLSMSKGWVAWASAAGYIKANEMRRPAQQAAPTSSEGERKTRRPDDEPVTSRAHLQ